MVAVGMLSAQIGGRAIWTVPATFVSVMAIGAAVGVAGIHLPFVEVGITGSVLALGAAIVSNGKIPINLAMVFVGLFALFHGNAHGTELPTATSTMALTFAYVAGFLIATAGLHLVGAFLGMIAEKQKQGVTLLRLSGALIALVGIVMIAQLG